jgi:hypothetical protein
LSLAERRHDEKMREPEKCLKMQSSLNEAERNEAGNAAKTA